MGRGARRNVSRGRGARGGRGRRAGGPDFRATGYNDGVACGVDESVVGIQEYLRPQVTGFHGSIKQRFSDFIVREVALDGRVVQLTDVPRGSPSAKKAPKVSEVFKDKVLVLLQKATKEKLDLPMPIQFLVGKLSARLLGLWNRNKRLRLLKQQQDHIEQLATSIAPICGDETAGNLRTFMVKLFLNDEEGKENACQSQSGDETPVKDREMADMTFFFPPIEAKETRAKVHQLVRQYGSGLVVSDTTNNASGVAVIRVRRVMIGGKKRKDMDQRGENTARSLWPTNRPDYLQFVLYKRNLETNSVMMQLAKAMHMNVSSFTYAGTKDKRGITTQLCTVYRGSKEKLEKVNRAEYELDTCNFLVGNATFVPERINLGDLRGNRFSITIRDLPEETVVSDEQLHGAIQSWSEYGFINYFGLQRFGTKSIATHEIGRAILQRNYKRVVDMILAPQEGDATKIREIRQTFQKNLDTDSALKALPPYLIAERAVLHGLRTHGITASAAAIQCIPRHLRMMYTHAYQSYVWNSMASDRLTLFSRNSPVIGDLVIPYDSFTEDLVSEDESDARLTKKTKKGSETLANAILVTPENLSQYSIYDVVLPLPGYNVRYPEHSLKERYDELMKKDNVDFFSLERATNSEYHLPGSYRHLLKKPEDVTYQLKRYTDPTIPLLETDVDRLLGRTAPVSISNGKFGAVCLEFQLGPSSYATMALRELLKQSSNVQVQLQLKQTLEAKTSN
ncbi:hypothetical protein PsorP6_016537 [Peronosclerospora sorghi]|uniref:Uncharacterized protein n=1 Tax=Peronosclerospora sorghi TaxID=230839 RepID=A0ACC0VM62_9STRA|nr:hypothetical protein PsorP6_016537 [Peronosclerospora sorghi]